MRNVIRICKLAGLQLILTLQVYSQYAYSSTRNIANQGPDLSLRSQEDKQSLLTVLKELNKARGVYFLYSEEAVGNKMVNPVRDMKAEIEKILDGVLDNTGLKYKKVSDNTFVILKGKEKVKDVSDLKPYAAPTGAVTLVDRNYAVPYQTITGRVVSTDGNPLSGVSVRVKGTNNGTTTNVNGEFSIQANKGDILVFSYVGFQAQEVPVNENTDIRITLSATTQQMSEVIVTALGVRKEERRLGYAVGKVPGADLTQAREINLGNALEGRVAGVNSTLQLTGPGGSSNVLIRGNVSLNGLSQPLYVINGVPMSNDQLGSAGMWGGADLGDALTSINPDDIQDITVLKGAAAAALYGQLAKNGVILITTKSGRAKQALGIEVNSNVQIDKINHFLDFQNVYGQGTLGAKPTDSVSAQNTGLSSWGAKLDGSSYIGIDGKQHTYSDQGNNLDRFYRTGSTFSNTVAFSGGSDAGSYRFSLGDLRSNSVYPNSQYIRNTANLSMNYRMSEHWSGEGNILYTKETGKNRSNLSDAPGNGNFAIGFLPPNVNADWLKPGYDANGNEIRFSSDAFSTNPFFAANKFQNNTEKNRIFGVGSLRFSPVNWLYFQGRLSNDFYAFNATQITPTGTAYRPTGSLDNEIMTNSNLFNADVLINGAKKFSHDNIGVSLSLGSNYQKYAARTDAINANGFAFPFLYNPSTATTRNASTSTPRYEVHSVYGELELSFKNSIYLNVTDRNDWSSTLPVANNSYNYPSANISYVFTENLKASWLNFGKLRAGIAQIGNDAPAFSTLLYYNTNGSINGQPLGSIGSTIPNNLLQPTKIKEYEIGLETRMLNNRLNFDVAVYDKNTLNDIVSVTVSSASGYSNGFVNIGKLENKGIEISLGGIPISTPKFKWASNFNFAYNKNTVKQLAEGQSLVDKSESRTTVGFVGHVLGLPAYQIRVNDVKKDAKGQWVLNASGFPQPSDALIPVGTAIAPTTGGWSNDFSYRNFQLSVLIDYKFGAKVYSGTNANAYAYGLQKETLNGRESGITINGVDDNGAPVTKTLSAQDYYGALSSIGIFQTYSADFIKLRSAALTYSLPGKLFNGKVQGISISLVARNLFYFKRDTPNIDPEANYSQIPGLEYASLPSTKSFGLNLNLRF